MTDAARTELSLVEAGGRQDVLLIRGEPVVLAARVAAAFGVATREVNQAVTRNSEKFGDAHTFEPTEQEVAGLTSLGVIPKPGRGGSRALPRVFTHKGVARLATVMSSPQALAATDRIIDTFIAVHQAIASGRKTLQLQRPSPLLAATGAQVSALRQKVLDALNGVLDTVIDPRRKLTVRDELGEVGSNALSSLKEHLRTTGLNNEKIQAETLLVLEQASEIRDRRVAQTMKSQAETERLRLENLEKQISIVRQLLILTEETEPNPVTELFDGFIEAQAQPGARGRPIELASSNEGEA